MNIKTPFIMCLAGSPRSGKSHLIKYILSSLSGKYDIIHVFTKTAFNKAYAEFIPERWIHPGYDSRVIQNLLTLSGRAIDQGKKLRSLLILDDCLDPGAFRTQIFQDLISYYRHYGISLMMVFQYLQGNAPTSLREICDYACIFKQRSANAKLGSYNAFLNEISKEQFDNLMKKLPQYNFIFVDRTSDNPITIRKAPAQFREPRIQYKSRL